MKKLFFTLLTLLTVYMAGAQNCATHFTLTTNPSNNFQVTLTNTSNVTLVPGSTPMFWIQWGDGNSEQAWLNSSHNHTYLNAGTYAVVLTMVYYDSLNNNALICSGLDSSVAYITTPCASSITAINNGGSSYTFTANNLGGGTSPTYSWDFGDGSTGTGSPVTHQYTTSGFNTVTLTTVVGTCTSTVNTVVNVWNGTLNCANLSANFTVGGAGYTRTFTNLSSWPSGAPSVVRRGTWNFGDGSALVTTTGSPSHTYSATGSYLVTLYNEWIDSSNQNILCSDSFQLTVHITTPPPPQNIISGGITWDSLSNNPFQATFKVWLIEMDSAANTLTAVDSTIASGWMYASYAFNNKAAGSYRVKAAVVNGSNGAGTLLPTYHAASAYWNTATVINHTGGSSLNKHIHMLNGTFAGGPGFIGGNISQGANKGTTGGVPNLLVMLRDNNNGLVRFTYTDANGDYSFGNLPTGTYNVYPEAMNYMTTPSSALNLASGQTYIGGVNFEQTSTDITPIATGIGSLPQEELFTVYPNPSQGQVTIKWDASIAEEAQVQVVDMTGRRVFHQNMNTGTAASLDLSGLQSGVYFIKIVTEKAQHSQKISIRK